MVFFLLIFLKSACRVCFFALEQCHAFIQISLAPSSLEILVKNIATDLTASHGAFFSGS